MLQPIVVRSLGGGDYELIMGERRWRAAQLAELTEIPAIVRETADEAMLRDALLENLHREQLHALEEAAAYTQLLTDFGCTHDELGARVGKLALAHHQHDPAARACRRPSSAGWPPEC